MVTIRLFSVRTIFLQNGLVAIQWRHCTFLGSRLQRPESPAQASARGVGLLSQTQRRSLAFRLCDNLALKLVFQARPLRQCRGFGWWIYGQFPPLSSRLGDKARCVVFCLSLLYQMNPHYCRFSHTYYIMLLESVILVDSNTSQHSHFQMFF